MALTIPGDSCSSSRVPLKKYDVFISFRGEDTRDNFTSHLHASLRRNQIETYIDYRLEKGDEVWPALVQAIQDSTVFLVILSENYASSTWCLNELLEIMEFKNNGLHIIPVFYRIDPSHVRKQTGSYQTAFAKHEQDPKHNRDKVHQWKAVLHEVANIVGFDSRCYRTEADLIEDIRKDVLKKLDHKYPNELRGPYVLDQNHESIENLLRSKSKEVLFIGIWGMAGIGKTTMATALFDKVSSQYEGSCFLKNVREESKRHGLSYLCCKLFSKLIGRDLNIDTNIGSSFNMSLLKRKKVFIVLDDVNSSNHLENLVGAHDWLGAGSRVIVTTRNKHVLISRSVDEIYEAKPMNFQDSLLLFCLNAFNKRNPEKGYEELSKRIIVHCNGIPLALKVLGSFLHSKSVTEWDSALAKLKKVPDAEIQKVLRLSYDELDDFEKNIFLDIACFFNGHERDNVTRILDACGFFAVIGIRNLLDKALITITWDNCIVMHDLIQEMGREIVRHESIKDPGRRSRLWNSEEVCDILRNTRGTDAVEGILLDLTNVTCLNLSSWVLRKMPNLRLLCLYYPKLDTRNCNCVYLTKGLASLPNSLRYIRWDACPLKSFPSTCWPEKLVQLSMRYSHVEKLWNGVQNLPSLERLDLTYSNRLMELPDLSGALNLKYVYLAWCTSLPHLHPSISSLPKLETLSLLRCDALKSLWGSSHQASLPSASDCSNFQDLSITSDRISYLMIGKTAMNEVPSSILHLRNLRRFDFLICAGLKELPENFAISIVLIDPIENNCDAFITLSTVLPSPGFRYVKGLHFFFHRSLSELPDSISLLTSLEWLSLEGGHIISLPESIKYLPRLMVVNLSSCKRLLSIPELPPSIQILNAMRCVSIKAVSSSTREKPKRNKGVFLFRNCIKLDQDSLDTILEDALVRFELGASAVSFEEEEDAYCGRILSEEEICICLPAGSNKVRNWLSYYSTEALITIEIPPNSNFSTIAFCVVLSQVQSFPQNLGCNCYLETKGDQWLCITRFLQSKRLRSAHGSKLHSDHVFLWHDAKCCETIMKAIKESEAINDGGAIDNPRLKFVFFGPSLNPHDKDKDMMIKECGLRLIYPSEDQVVEEEGRPKSRRSLEIHELEEPEPSAGRKGEQEELVPPAKKIKL